MSHAVAQSAHDGSEISHTRPDLNEGSVIINGRLDLSSRVQTYGVGVLKANAMAWKPRRRVGMSHTRLSVCSVLLHKALEA